MKDVIELARQIEENAAAIYTRAASRNADPVLAAILKCLIEDEKRHARRFGELMETIPAAEGPPELEALGRALMRDVIGDRSFSLGEANFGKLGRPEELLALAIKFEFDKKAFYHLLQSFAADDAAFNTLETIISEETSHIERLQQLLECRRNHKTPGRCALC